MGRESRARGAERGADLHELLDQHLSRHVWHGDDIEVEEGRLEHALDLRLAADGLRLGPLVRAEQRLERAHQALELLLWHEAHDERGVDGPKLHREGLDLRARAQRRTWMWWMCGGRGFAEWLARACSATRLLASRNGALLQPGEKRRQRRHLVGACRLHSGACRPGLSNIRANPGITPEAPVGVDCPKYVILARLALGLTPDRRPLPNI